MRTARRTTRARSPAEELLEEHPEPPRMQGTPSASGGSVKSRLIALSIGLLNELFKEKWTEDIPGGILESFGRTFQNKTRLYVSPWLNRKSGEFVTARTFRAPEQYVHLYQHFLANGLVVDVPFFNEFLLRHTPRDIQRMIAADEDIWKTLVPEEAHRSALHFR